VLGLFAVSAAVLALRAPVAFSKIFADDGTEFLGSASRGTSVGSLFTEYRGYLSVIPRVIAECVVQFPSRWWAIGIAIAAIAVTAGTASLTYLVARSYIPHRALCAVLGLSVPLVPALRTESINSVANLQFVLVFAAFWLFLAPPRNAARTLLRCSALLLIGLSAPLMFVLMPLPIARLFRFGRRELPAFAATAAALVAQVTAYLFWSSSARGGGATAAANAAADYSRDVVEPTFGNFHLIETRAYAAALGVIVAIGGVGLAWWWFSKVKATRDWGPDNEASARLDFMIALSVLLSGFFMVVAVQLGGTSYRYAVAPSLFLCTFLVACGSRVWSSIADSTMVHGLVRSRRYLAGLTVLGVSILVLLGWARGFTASEYRRSGPSWSHSLAAASAACRAADHRAVVRVPIAPRAKGQTYWYINLACTSV
jgi:hypothetical protein